MSTNKLVNFLNKPRSTKGPKQTHLPVVLTDSKGNWLRDRATDQSEIDLIWWAKSSDTVSNRCEWLEKNLGEKIKNIGNIWLYVWLSTCNLTSKEKNYISLTSLQGDETVNHIYSKLQSIKSILTRHPGCKITFLETPLYSIEEHNKYKNHKDPSTFKDQDLELHRQIRVLNDKIRSLNAEAHCHSPSFNTDLITSSRVKQGRKHQKSVTHKRVNYKLLADGIHPDVLLARTWVKKIAEQSKEDCWPNQHDKIVNIVQKIK